MKKTWYQVYQPNGVSFGFSVNEIGIVSNFPLWNFNGNKLDNFKWWFNKDNVKEVVKICEQLVKTI